MIDEYVNNPKSPKYHVKKYLESIKDEITGKTIVDIPAGNGVTSEILQNLGVGELLPFDLFPEYFKLASPECKRIDIMDGVPLPDGRADWVVCQEGIEHFSDQLKTLKEFSRILKKNGKLLITTPSYSNLYARFSYLLFESETNKQMPPNEIDDIWMSDMAITKEIYCGHVFLIGLQKLRILAKLAGLKIKEIKYTRLSKASLLLFPFFYPLILLSSYLRFFRNMRRNPQISANMKKEVYEEQLKININPYNLLNHHTMIILEKEREQKDVYFHLDGVIKPFDKIM